MKKADVFARLVPRLVDAIPRAVAGLGLAEPICALRVNYYDTHAPGAYLLLKPVTEAFRRQVLADEGPGALYRLWAAGEETGDGPRAFVGEADPDAPAVDPDPVTTTLLREAYALLGRNEDRHMPAYRRAVQRAVYQLNGTDWSSICPVTDDFVVVAADGSQHFADDDADLAGSIPPERLDLLRARGRLGPGAAWDRRPDRPAGGDVRAELKRLKQAVEERARALPVPDRIAYWIGQLDRMAAGQPCDVTALGRNAHYPLERLAEVGGRAAGPLLELAVRWADQPEWDRDHEDTANPTPMAEVIFFALRTAEELASPDRQTETLFREFLARSCRANEGRALWGSLPFHCAKCLRQRFDRYPEPKMAGNNALVNRAEFLRPPLP